MKAVICRDHIKFTLIDLKPLPFSISLTTYYTLYWIRYSQDMIVIILRDNGTENMKKKVKEILIELNINRIITSYNSFQGNAKFETFHRIFLLSND